MSPKRFIAGLVEVVHGASVEDTMAMLRDGPPGRRPQPLLVELSRWYQGLQTADQERVRQVLELAVHASLFGGLCVLDGARTLEASTEFEVFAVRDGSREQLNSPHGQCLHDEYQSQVYGRVFGPGA